MHNRKAYQKRVSSEVKHSPFALIRLVQEGKEEEVQIASEEAEYGEGSST